MTVEEILEKATYAKGKEIEKVIAYENYGIVFLKPDKYEDISTLYETIAELLYNQAMRKNKS
ncbi:hypothetical protein AB1L05_04560 [Cytobacillus horneckiae]|uniref:hypothetical protein n=1 Tax=Cytobacillus horneckiae TaxID=549687 RepID=UPI0039A1EE02